jgi:hypothetical protein
MILQDSKLQAVGATASRTWGSYLPGSVIDNNLNTDWIADDFAPQWIQLDLGHVCSLSQIRLLVLQDPAGHTTHQIYGGPTQSNLALLGTLDGNTQSGQWLELNLSASSIKYVRVMTTASPSWIGWAEIEIYGSLSRGGSSAYGGTPLSLPGTIEVENYNEGGAEVAYHDTSAGTHGQDYDNPPNYPPPTHRQPTDVDIYKASNYYNNGYLTVMQAGDWMNYSVNISQEGTYTLQARAGWGGATGGTFHVEVDGLNVTGPIQIPDTAWALTTIGRSGISLPAGQHGMLLVADTNAGNGCTGDIDSLSFTKESSGLSPDAGTSIPARITFDDLPTATPVSEQYLSRYGVRFHSANFAFPTHTHNVCGPFCGTTSGANYLTTLPDTQGQVVVEFAQPASNLAFYAIGVDRLSGTFGFVDIYRNGLSFPSNTFPLNAILSSFTVGFTSGSFDNITKVVIRGIDDPAGVGFDDFSFNIPADVKITSGRVSGDLNGTTQKALLGADVALNASPTPSGFGGGTYTWSCTGPCALLSGTNASSVTVRSTALSSDPGRGPMVVNVSYSKSGLVASGFGHNQFYLAYANEF